jgi:hypothetical protein
MVAKKLENYELRRCCARTSQPDGVFETCRLSPQGLIIEIEYNGKAVLGRVGYSINAPNLGKVRDFLLQYSGDSMAAIENLDVGPDQFNT